MKKCPKCGYVTDEDDRVFCPFCGGELILLEVRKDEGTVLAVKSKVKGAGGNVIAYGSEVEGGYSNKGHQEVMAVRSKVAGGNIVEGNYIQVNIINSPAPIRNEAPSFYLVYLDDSGREKTLQVVERIEIYRKDGSWDIVAWDGWNEIKLDVEDMSVSRRKKSMLVYSDGKNIYVRDRGMRNGVFVNGERIDGERKLNDGDVISVGSLSLRVERKHNRVSVKRDSLTPIPEDLARFLPPEMVYQVQGRYYLNAIGLNAGEKLMVGGREIVVRDSSPRESVRLSGNILNDALLMKMVESMLRDVKDPEIKSRIIHLTSLYRESQGEERDVIKKKLLNLLERC